MPQRGCGAAVMGVVQIPDHGIIARGVLDVAARLRRYRSERVPAFLIGECSTPRMVRDVFRPLAWGRMWVHRTIRLYEGERWGFDNGAFGAWRSGEKWDADKYLKRLDAAYALGTPRLAVVPDLPAEGERSLDFSLEWLDRLPADWPWFLAVQDGMTVEMVRPHLRRFSGLFLGGTDKFKASGAEWVRLAKSASLQFHYGRTSTIRKLEHARRIGADSGDSTQPLWTAEKLQEFVAYYEGRRQVDLMDLISTERQ